MVVGEMEILEGRMREFSDDFLEWETREIKEGLKRELERESEQNSHLER